MLVNAHEVTKSFSHRPLFKNITFGIEAGERVGLIGPNGAGKSTLLKMIAGKTSPDSGTLSLKRNLRIGYLEQVPAFSEGDTLMSSILSTADSNAEEWESASRAQELISRCGLDDFPTTFSLSEMSGGWKKRVAFARELMKSPDLLLLDEPTNHLDVESVLWLEEFLRDTRIALLVVTHDRLFLQRVTNRIIELDPRHEGGLLSINGDFATYLEVRSQLLASQERRETILKNTLRRETEWLRQGAKARTTKQQARIQRAEELGQEVQELSERNVSRRAKLDFQTGERQSKKLLEAKNISKSYGETLIFSKVNLVMGPGTRVGLLGENGSGKTTLIRVLLGLEKPDSGEVIHADSLKYAYFDQTRNTLDPEETVAKTLCPSGEFVDFRGSRVHVRSYLDRFLFTKEQADMRVGKLSGGEQSRLLLAKLMLIPCNVLVLDEPTNDLDLATLHVLEECLTEFNGSILLVSHDRYFLDAVSTHILAFPQAGAKSRELTSFADLFQWERWRLQQNARPSKESKSSKEPVVEKKVKTKLSFKEQRELDSMESTILTAEARLEKLLAETALPENQSNAILLAKLTTEIAEAQDEVERLYGRWAELST